MDSRWQRSSVCPPGPVLPLAILPALPFIILAPPALFELPELLSCPSNDSMFLGVGGPRLGELLVTSQ